MLSRAALFTALTLALYACRTSKVRPAADGAACAETSTCGALSRCDFEPDLCGKGKKPGTCRPRPSLCSDRYAPICGCDGTIHANACTAEVAGVDFDINGTSCNHQRIPDWIACGGRYCDARTSYCEIVLSDVVELPSDYTCKPLPPTCKPGGSDCGCFPTGTRCLSFCGQADTGGVPGLRLTCRR
jgi:hypothetical protein